MFGECGSPKGLLHCSLSLSNQDLTSTHVFYRTQATHPVEAFWNISVGRLLSVDHCFDNGAVLSSRNQASRYFFQQTLK